MDLLACLPCLLGLLKTPRDFIDVTDDKDWVDLIYQYSIDRSPTVIINRRTNVVDYLRLFVALNAYEI